MEKKNIYADYAATSPVSEKVLRVMLPYFTENFGNPSGVHRVSRTAAKAVAEARRKIASAIGADFSEIYFTSGGTEADNWALSLAKGKKIVTANVEHKAVLTCCKALEKAGTVVTYLPVNRDGFVTAKQVEAAIDSETALVSVMYANNEIGTVMPIEEIAEICRKKGVLFHTDAVQAIGNLPVDVKRQKIDMLSCSGHKIGAPKGIGFLYVCKGTPIESLIKGGNQEFGLRAGTENVPAIVGLGEALKLACENQKNNSEYVRELRDKLIDGLLKITDVRLNGSCENRLCGNVNVSFSGVESEAVLLMLDAEGICASGGSACTTGDDEPSHVLTAIGVDKEYLNGTIRFTLSSMNTTDEIDYIIEKTSEIIKRLRKIRGI
ncbi:MAG: aminotransferase class V-fold PLP-dependent enzyme [Oscillospiraceae bacterium]|nr:aminotransferase class V-fold PLP-dependent enzyme [Oscillospiraceae bacterium]